MPKLTVLVPLDGSKQAELALAYLTALQPLTDMRVRLLSVSEADDSTPAEEQARRKAYTAQYLERITDHTRANYSVAVESVQRTGRPYEEILDEACREDVGLVLMTTHGRTITEPEHLGGVADKVIRGIACPTLLIGPHASVPLQIESITVPLDGSTLAAEALPVARALAEKLGSRLRLVRAVSHPPYEIEAVDTLATGVIDAQEALAALYLADTSKAIDGTIQVETAVLNGPPTGALMADLRENRPDLVVMSSHGHTGFIRWALGSVTDRLLRGPVPILVLRPKAEASGPGLF